MPASRRLALFATLAGCSATAPVDTHPTDPRVEQPAKATQANPCVGLERSECEAAEACTVVRGGELGPGGDERPPLIACIHEQPCRDAISHVCRRDGTVYQFSSTCTPESDDFQPCGWTTCENGCVVALTKSDSSRAKQEFVECREACANAPKETDARPKVPLDASWGPQPMRRAPPVTANTGPAAFYALAGPFASLETRTARLAARHAKELPDTPRVAEIEKPTASHTALFYGWEASFRDGLHALGVWTEDGWFHTPPLARHEKSYPSQRVGDSLGHPVDLGRGLPEAEEYTVTFEAGYAAGPFTLKLVCIETPVPACTRPWLARAERGGKTDRGRVVYETRTTYPGDGTIVIETTTPPTKHFRADVHRPHRPPPLQGVFEPFTVTQ